MRMVDPLGRLDQRHDVLATCDAYAQNHGYSEREAKREFSSERPIHVGAPSSLVLPVRGRTVHLSAALVSESKGKKPSSVSTASLVSSVGGLLVTASRGTRERPRKCSKAKATRRPPRKRQSTRGRFCRS